MPGVAGVAMTSKRIILLTIGALAILVLGSVTATILYYHHHPSALKTLIERSVSGSTGTSLTISDISYSITPLSVEAKGIVVEPGAGQHGFYAAIPDFKADMILAGPFGHKTLTFSNLRVADFSLRISSDMTLPEISQQPEVPSSLFSRVLKRMIRVFVFRDITFQSAEVINGKTLFQFGDQTVEIDDIQARINPEQGVEASCNARAKWPREKMQLLIPCLHVKADDVLRSGEQGIRGRFQVNEATFESPHGNIRGFNMISTFVYDHSHEKLTFDPMHMRFEGMTFGLEDKSTSVPSDLECTVQGSFDLAANQVDISMFHLVSRELFELTGAMHLGLGANNTVTVTNLDGKVFPHQCLSMLHQTLAIASPPVRLSGPVHLHGNLEGMKGEQAWHWQGDMEVLLSRNPYSYVTEEVRSAGRVSGNLRAQGSFPDTALSVNLKGDEITFSGMGITVKPGKARISLRGKYPLHRVEEIYIAVPQATLAMGDRNIQVDRIEVRSKGGTVDAENGAISLPEVALTSSLLKNLRLSLHLDESEGVAELTGEDTHLAQAALALDLVPPDWEFSGLDSLKVRAVLKHEDRLALTGTLGFKDFAFMDSSGNRMGEGILIKVGSEAEIDFIRANVTADTTLNIDGGEVLWDNFYFNLAKNPFSASLKGAYGTEKKALQVSDLTIGLRDILGFHVHGSLIQQARDPSMDLLAKIEETPLQPIYRHFVSEPFGMQKPSLASMNTEGSISADMRLTGTPDDLTAKGNFTWHDGALYTDDNVFSLQGVELALPLWYQSGEDEAAEETTRGSLSVQSMLVPFLPEQPLNLVLDVGPNRLFVRSPTTIGIPGGDVIIGPLTCKDIFGAKRSVRTSVEVRDVDIDELLPGIWSSPIQGTIDGRLDPVTFEADTLTSQGDLKADAFGGQVILSGIGASDLSTSGPVFRFDARWSNLSLAKLTTGTSFGRVDGVLQGYVKDMEIAYGQPQAFDLLLETIKTKGVPQKISVKAVDNIAQLGGGTSPFMGLAGQFASFFKEFPYTKMGVHASLHNDIFRINGTVKEGGKEYLVKRGSFSGINVVNQNPNNQVRFKDMVKRIRRVTESDSGPVVK